LGYARFILNALPAFSFLREKTVTSVSDVNLGGIQSIYTWLSTIAVFGRLFIA
jgi:hypothetical protein